MQEQVEANAWPEYVNMKTGEECIEKSGENS